MRYKIILFLLLALSSDVVAQHRHPGYREVVTKFYSENDLSALEYPHVEFEKRKAGWYFRTISFKDNQPVRNKSRLYYSFKDGKYVETGFPLATGDAHSDEQSHVNKYEEHQFAVQPYYGYKGWFKDVIEELGKKANPTDEDLYALSRAYTSAALGPLTNPNDDTPESELFPVRFRKDPLSAAHLALFERNADSAISKIARLARRSPLFATSLGPARYKYGNEVMTKFHIMQSFTTEKWKKMSLPDDLFDDSVLAASREQLQNCPENAILLTFGDTDFYPALYLQQKEGLLKDVYIINYSIIAIGYYIFRLNFPHQESPAIRFTADTSAYRASRHQYIRLENGPEHFTVKEIIGEINGHRGNETLQFSTSSVSFDTYTNSVINRAKQRTTRNVALGDAPYLLRNQWILLDILNSLNGRGFAITQEFDDEMKGLNIHFTKKGNIYILGL